MTTPAQEPSREQRLLEIRRNPRTAQDRIERLEAKVARLEAALREIAGQPFDFGHLAFSPTAQEFQRIAQRALGGGEP